MSTVLVVTPIIIASWPAITAAVTAGVATMGFTTLQHAASQSRSSATKTREEIDVCDSEVMTDAVHGEEHIVVQRDGITATFRKDERGQLKLCMEGSSHSKAELRELGEELLGRVTQQYAYHRIVSELKDKNMTIVDEHMTENESVKIRVRNW